VCCVKFGYDHIKFVVVDNTGSDEIDGGALSKADPSTTLTSSLPSTIVATAMHAPDNGTRHTKQHTFLFKGGMMFLPMAANETRYPPFTFVGVEFAHWCALNACVCTRTCTGYMCT
jgi:hypothetical protein